MQEFDISFENPSNSLLAFCGEKKYKTILADPPWQFQNRTGKVAPEHKRLNRYPTMRLNDIASLPVREIAAEKAHLYLWVPNALLPDGLAVMRAWGFEYKTNIVWEKVRKDGEPDGRGVGFYFRNVTELLLFGIRGQHNRTLSPANRTRFIRSSRDAAKAHIWNCLLAACARAGICGEIRQIFPMHQAGPHTQTIRRRKNKSFRPSCRSLYRCVMDVILPTKFVLPSVHSSRFVLYCLAGGFL